MPIQSDSFIPPQTRNLEALNPFIPPVLPLSMLMKETLNNDHIIAIQPMHDEMPKMNFETKTIENNELQPHEAARFTIVTDFTTDIMHFDFSIIADASFIHSSHLERINENRAAIIINNLTDKPFLFSIHYMSLHK